MENIARRIARSCEVLLSLCLLCAATAARPDEQIRPVEPNCDAEELGAGYREAYTHCDYLERLAQKARDRWLDMEYNTPDSILRAAWIRYEQLSERASQCRKDLNEQYNEYLECAAKWDWYLKRKMDYGLLGSRKMEEVAREMKRQQEERDRAERAKQKRIREELGEDGQEVLEELLYLLGDNDSNKSEPTRQAPEMPPLEEFVDRIPKEDRIGLVPLDESLNEESPELRIIQGEVRDRVQEDVEQWLEYGVRGEMAVLEDGRWGYICDANQNGRFDRGVPYGDGDIILIPTEDGWQAVVFTVSDQMEAWEMREIGEDWMIGSGNPSIRVDRVPLPEVPDDADRIAVYDAYAEYVMAEADAKENRVDLGEIYTMYGLQTAADFLMGVTAGMIYSTYCGANLVIDTVSNISTVKSLYDIMSRSEELVTGTLDVKVLTKYYMSIKMSRAEAEAEAQKVLKYIDARRRQAGALRKLDYFYNE